YVPVFAGCARNWNNESSPVGTCPPVHVTWVMTASSPEPVCCSMRFQPGLGTKESIEKLFGNVRTTFVVYAFAFSVGTARLYSCSTFASETAGFMRACADAPSAATSAETAAARSAERSFIKAPFSQRGG